jgi:1-acyl-sn-glycerol-3-phosphate acyltransferase
MDLHDIAEMEPGALRAWLPGWMVAQVDAGADAEALLAALSGVLATTADDALRALLHSFAHAGEAYRFHAADPVAQRLMGVLLSRVVRDATLAGRAHVERFLRDGPHRRMIVGNHLGYVDAAVTSHVLSGAGLDALSARLLAVAGPKVYSDPWRRMASLAMHTRKTAQSARVATEQAALSPRAVAAIAMDTVADVARCMDDGYVVVLYPEGTRSRDGRLGSFLRAAERYLALPDVQILPLALTGTDAILPRDATRMRPGPVTLAFAPPMAGGPAEARGSLLARVHAAVAEHLPPAHQPAGHARAVL